MKDKFESFFSGWVPLIGRVLLAMVFLMAGYSKITGWEGTSAYMASVGMPLVPVFLVGAIAAEVLGGLSLILGVKARWGAAALFLFLIPATLVFHAFWNLSGPEQGLQTMMFIKNLAIMGGLAMITAFGSGRFSLDRIPCPFKPRDSK